MKELIESKWQEILNILVKEHEISEVAVNTWIQPLIIQTITDDSITFFMVRGPRGIEFIKHKYYDIYLSMAIEQVTGKQLPTPILQPRNQNRKKSAFLQNILVI